jgi:carboxymethylenebutenolidase
MRTTLPSGTPAELALPESTTTRGVVLIPDIMGLRPLFDDMVARLAAENGWAVCAVEPFPGQEDLDLPGRMNAVAKLEDDRVLGDVSAAADLLVERTGVDRVAVMGFCMGGMYTFKSAGLGRFDRAAPFYGMIRLPDNWRGPGHAEPLDQLRKPGASQVMAIIGENDPYTPPADVDELRTLSNVEVVVYPGAEHGFVHDASRPAHRADDAEDAWRRLTLFFA